MNGKVWCGMAAHGGFRGEEVLVEEVLGDLPGGTKHGCMGLGIK